jgi:hypothetical protein
MRQELMFWLRTATVALGAFAIIGAIALIGGPISELVALQ